jgi:hypothetical protein
MSQWLAWRRHILVLARTGAHVPREELQRVVSPRLVRSRTNRTPTDAELQARQMEAARKWEMAAVSCQKYVV